MALEQCYVKIFVTLRISFEMIKTCTKFNEKLLFVFEILSKKNCASHHWRTKYRLGEINRVKNNSNEVVFRRK